MLSRRAILALVLLLPFAAQAKATTTSGKKRHHHVEATSDNESGAKHATSKKKRASHSSSKSSKVSEETASAEKKTAKAEPKAEEPTVVTKGSTAASKLSTRAIDAIPSAGASLYDRHTAQAPSSGFLGLFGPKAAGVHYDSRMIQAAQIAETRARAHSVRACWRYVKEALLAANVVDTYPQTALAKQAGDELINKHGFRKLSITDPFKAPVGSVLVYGGPGAGHVEIRTSEGFVSDFESPTPSKRPLLGVFVKPS